jgi:hypothetical protein
VEGTVAVPALAAWAFGVVFVAFVGWAISDRREIGKVLDDVRERLVRLETKVNGGKHG